MQINIRDTLKLILLLIIYAMLGSMHVYAGTLIILFPILALPMTIWMLSNKQDIKRDIFIHLGITFAIFLLTQSIDNAILYIINVSIPSYIVTTAYRKRLDIPHIIIYTTLGVTASVYIFVIARSYMGVNYLEGYFASLDAYKAMSIEIFDMLPKQNQGAVSAERMAAIKEMAELSKELVATQVMLLKHIYPALTLVVSMILSAIMIFLVTLIGKLKKWHMPTLKQIFHFKLSKGVPILLIIGLLLVETKGSYSDVFGMLGMNLFFFMQTLLQIVGIISLIMTIRKAKLSTLVKTMGIVLSFMVFFTAPMFIIMIGLFDTLFNYRKAEIVV